MTDLAGNEIFAEYIPKYVRRTLLKWIKRFRDSYMRLIALYACSARVQRLLC